MLAVWTPVRHCPAQGRGPSKVSVCRVVERDVPASIRLVGTILAVREGVASINVGSARGVKRGMKMVVHRGEMLIGYLRIDEVSVQEAAGVITDNKIPAATGDKVFTQKKGA